MGDAAGEDAAETAQGVVLAGPELAGVTLGRGGGDRPAGADDGAAGGGRGGHLSGRSGRRRRPLLLGFDAAEGSGEELVEPESVHGGDRSREWAAVDRGRLRGNSCSSWGSNMEDSGTDPA